MEVRPATSDPIRWRAKLCFLCRSVAGRGDGYAYRAVAQLGSRVDAHRTVAGKDPLALDALDYPAVAMIDSVDSLDPLSARWPRGEGVTEVLRLAGYRPILEFHNADYVIRLLVVLEDEFADPKVSTAEDASHGEAFRIRLGFARRLNVGPATDALARLRIFENCISSVDFVFRVEVVGVGCFPVALQNGPYVVVTHGNSPSVTRLHRRCDQDPSARSIIRHEGIIRR
jgi:hypothetical protein